MSKFVPQIPLVDGKNLLHATTCHVAADIYETLNTGSWNTLDRLKSEKKRRRRRRKEEEKRRRRRRRRKERGISRKRTFK